uniref:Uncharacterized protein n=1 Tax=Solanum lycopersicum TaxID=4081 RepID=A0A3Q7F2Q8_SOLLC
MITYKCFKCSNFNVKLHKFQKIKKRQTKDRNLVFRVLQKNKVVHFVVIVFTIQ